MKPRERVLAALNHEEPDRVPIDAWLTPEIQRALEEELGISTEREAGAYTGNLALSFRLGNDLVMTYASTAPIASFYREESDSYVCPWGITWKRIEYQSGHYTEPVGHPLADETKLDSYKTPDPFDPEQVDKPIREAVERYGKDYAIYAGLNCMLFEISGMLRGLETLLQDMVVNKDFVHALLDKVMVYPLEVGKRAIQLGVDMVLCGDDLGTQHHMMMSPKMFREFCKPRYARMYQEFRRIRPDIKIAHHSCGHITEIVDDFVEIGLDALTPVQPGAMVPEEIKRKYGKRLTLWGCIDMQGAFQGTEADVEEEVKHRVRSLGHGGGLILQATSIQPNVPLRNVFAFYRAAKTYGTYPLPA